VDTYWLTITNAALGVGVLICCIAIAIGALQEIAAKRRLGRLSNSSGSVEARKWTSSRGDTEFLHEIQTLLGTGGAK
jgi:hypothetical protein